VDYSIRHLRFGWWSLVVFTSLGFGLESLHAFKIGAYLGVGNETRRLMWTLAHAHGALLSVIHLIYGLGLRVMPELRAHNQRFISSSLMAASLLLPGGFFLGGVAFHGADPGSAGAVLIPVGAALLLMATFLVARATAAIGLVGSPDRSKHTR
jgi:hypothetical protein